MNTKVALALILLVVPGNAATESKVHRQVPGSTTSAQRTLKTQLGRHVVPYVPNAVSNQFANFEPATPRLQQYDRELPPNQRRALPQTGQDDLYRERRRPVEEDGLLPILRDSQRQAPARSTERTRQREFQRGAGSPYVSANAVDSRQMPFFPGNEEGEDAPWDPLLLILLILSLGLFLCLVSCLQRLRDKIFYD